MLSLAKSQNMNYDSICPETKANTLFLHTDPVSNLNDLKRNTQLTLIEAKMCFGNKGLKLDPNKTQCIFMGSQQNIAKI